MDGDDVWVAVMGDMDARRVKGLAEYGAPVTPGKSLEDLLYWLRHRYAELLDDAVYTKAAILTVEGLLPPKGEVDLDELLSPTLGESGA